MTMENDLSLDSEDTASADAADDETTEGTEADPAAELAARFDAIEAKLELLSGLDVNGVRSALGRISALQSNIDELSKRNPAAELDPRISASESATVALAEALLNDPTTSDTTRATLQGAIRGVEQARTSREADRREAALLERVREAARPAATAAVVDANDPWQQATAAVQERAAALGVDPGTIPWNDIQARSNGNPITAAALAVEWLSEHKEDPGTARVAARRAAAGGGSPTRTDATASIEQLRARAEREGIPMTDGKSRAALAKDLGVSL